MTTNEQKFTFLEDCIYGEGKNELDKLVICPGCQALIRGDLTEEDVIGANNVIYEEECDNDV